MRARRGRRTRAPHLCTTHRRLGARPPRRPPPRTSQGAHRSRRTSVRLQPNEIASILREQIEKYDTPNEIAEVGTVIQLSDGIARVYGLENCVALEMIEFPHGVTGLALNLEEDNVAVGLFGAWELLSEGDVARRTGNVMRVPVGEQLVGRVVDPLGNVLDGGPALDHTTFPPPAFKAPGVVDRQPVKEPLQTGI